MSDDNAKAQKPNDHIEKYDLRALKPQSRTLILRDGREVEVLPPTVGQVLQLIDATKTAEEADKDSEDQVKVLRTINGTLKEIIPAMNQVEGSDDKPVDFQVHELEGVIEFVFGMATAPDQEKLKELKIKPLDEGKKAPGDGSASSPTSSASTQPTG